jgi:hypothetical protein
MTRFLNLDFAFIIFITSAHREMNFEVSVFVKASLCFRHIDSRYLIICNDGNRDR